jgi:predicted nucleic acid-binding protein
MVLADTSIWIDHLRSQDVLLFKLLQACQVRLHPYVIGELACGQLAQRQFFFELLNNLPQSRLASHHEAMQLIEQQQLMGLGIGYVDCHLLASVKLSSGLQLWTRDKRLKQAAAKLNIAFSEH